MSDFQPSASPQTATATTAAAVRTRALSESPALVELAAMLLHTPSMLGDMNPAELQRAVSFLRLATYPAGATVFRQGDASNTGYMLLILTGEVRVEATASGDTEPMDISVLGPGNMIGELGLIDGGPRSTTCTAVDVINVAVLSRKAIDLMMHDCPVVAAKLMINLSQRITERLRAMGQQLQMYGQLTASLQGEVDRLRARLEALELPDGTHSLRSGVEMETLIAARFLSPVSAGRVGIAPGVELRQPLRCSLAPP